MLETIGALALAVIAIAVIAISFWLVITVLDSRDGVKNLHACLRLAREDAEKGDRELYGLVQDARGRVEKLEAEMLDFTAPVVGKGKGRR